MSISVLQNYDLNDTKNYYSSLVNSSNEVFSKYIEVIIYFLKQFINSISTNTIYIKNRDLYIYLLNKGVSTISHIFKIMYLYTKNLNLTEFYCFKTSYYYIEFIIQNSEQHDNQINFNNASVFSYSKTIYKINKSYSKTFFSINNDNDTIIFKNIYMLITLYQIILKLNIKKYNEKLDKSDLLNDKIKLMDFINNTDSISHLFLHGEKDCSYRLKYILDFISCLKMKDTIIIECIYCVLKQLQSNNVYTLNKVVLIKRLLSEENKVKLDNIKDVNEYVDWLLL